MNVVKQMVPQLKRFTTEMITTTDNGGKKIQKKYVKDCFNELSKIDELFKDYVVRA